MEILPVKQIKINESLGQEIPEPFVKPPFLGILYGGVKSGKSCLLINFIYRIYPKVFSKIFFFSPNIFNDDIFDNNVVIDELVHKFNEDLDEIDAYVCAIVQIQEDEAKKDREHLLIIFDDIIGFIKPRTFIANLCTKYRHLKISMIFTTQMFRQIPNTIRANATFLCLFKTYNEKEAQKIFEELHHIPNIENMYRQGTNERFSFLYVNLRELTVYEKFSRCLFSVD